MSFATVAILLLGVAVPATVSSAEARRQVLSRFLHAPLGFEASGPQAGADYPFFARAPGGTLLLTRGGGWLLWRNDAAPAIPGLARGQLRMPQMRLLGSNPAPRTTLLDRLPGHSNYLIGRAPERWRTDIAQHGRVEYREVYRHIDLVYYGNHGQLEYDFIARPGGDPGRIRLGFDGVESLAVEPDGSLLARAGSGRIRLHRPRAYQLDESGRRREVAAAYRLAGRARLAFRLGEYDRRKPLIIDPVLAYSTFLGGLLYDFGLGITTDAAGNAYVAGYTSSPNFPATSGALDRTCGTDGFCNFSALDAFVTKLNAAGSAIVYSTFLGGNGNDYAYGIAVDSAGNAYVAGYTESSDFPTTAGAFQRTKGGGKDVYAAKLSADGSTLLYSTFLGGSQDEVSFAGTAVDASGNMYVTGYTLSPNFPTTATAFDRACGSDGSCDNGLRDAFVTRLNTSAGGAASLVYSTYLGGSNEDEGRAITLDGAVAVYVTGYTVSRDFPTTEGAFDRGCGTDSACNGGYRDAFVAKLNTSAGGAASLVYSTYLGGSGTDVGRGIAVDASGNAWVTGSSATTDFPVGSRLPSPPIQASFGGGPEDGFIAKLNAQGSALLYASYLGGGGEDAAEAVALDTAGNVYVAGYTNSTNFPTKSAVQGSNSGDDDVFLVKLAPSGALLYSTYLGGTGQDRGLDLALDAAGAVYAVGYTASGSFPTTPGAARTSSAGLGEAFVAKIVDTPGAPAINAGDIVNGSFNHQAPAPGSIATVFGAALSTAVAYASSVPLPASLAGVTVLVNGRAAPLFYVSPTQINFQTPWEAAGQAQAAVVVSVQGVASNAATVALPALSPGIFTVNQAGAGQGAILIAGTATIAALAGSIPGASTTPARAGQFVSIFATGLGPVGNPPATGAAALSNPLAMATNQVQVTIGGLPAVVSFAGLAPGFVGLYQVNAQVPAGAATGDAVPVVLSVGGASSNPVTVAIQ